ncbi:MAG TPA: nucleotide exchange factor GrpE [Bacillota bacterium]|nr:nucleotide exchange factor GrpE [Bacillota bacterium]
MEEENNQMTEEEKNETIDEQDIEVIEPDSDSETNKTDHHEENKESSKGMDENELDILQNKVDQLEKEKNLIEDKLLRQQAEFENFKKRTRKEKEAIHKFKSQDIATDILPVLDNFDRALHADNADVNEAYIEGVTMVYKQLLDALKTHGVEAIDVVGKEFDPNLHHAVMQVEDEDVESNIIVEELQKGYMLKDRVIRPAMVKVNK